MTDTKFVKGSSKLLRRITTIQAATGVLLSSDRIGQFLVRRTKERFDRQVDPDNKPWPALSEVTKRDKSRKGAGTKILQRTGTLKGAIDIIRGSSAGLLAVSTGVGVRIGVKEVPTRYLSSGKKATPPTVYGRYHQLGEGVPQRRFLGIGKLDVKAVDSLLRREIVKLAGLE